MQLLFQLLTPSKLKEGGWKTKLGHKTMVPKETHTLNCSLATHLAVEAAVIWDMANSLVTWASEVRSLVATVSSRTTAMAFAKESTTILIDKPLLKAREPVLWARELVMRARQLKEETLLLAKKALELVSMVREPAKRLREP